MELTEAIKSGIVAGLPVGIACAAVIAALIYAGVYKVADQTALQGAAIWFGVSLFVGVAGVWVWGLATARWSWGSTEYTVLVFGIAMGMSVLAFLPVYTSGKGHVMAVPFTILNFLEAIYFSIIIPKLVA